jgi:general secretion pathway protein C
MRLSSLLHAAFPVLTLAVFVSSASLVAGGFRRLARTPDSANSSRDVPRVDPQPHQATQSEFRGALPLVIDRGFLSAPDCDAIAVHIVTESTDRLWSLATLSVAGEPRPRLCRVGDQVAGHRVEFIGFNPRQSSAAVWLSSSKRICQASVAAGLKAPVAAPDAPPEVAANVERLSDSEFNLSRAAFEKLFDNVLELGRHLRVVPESKDGRRVGVRLFGVRPGTWLSALGVQNGDRIESINGFNCAEPEKLLEAYARLRTATDLHVKLTRRGAPAELAVHIR